jgi:magnesium transporter
MLTAYVCAQTRLQSVDPSTHMPAADIIWFDLESGTPEELAFVAKLTGLSLPAHEDLTEIENSARLSANGGVLTLSMPIVTRTPDGLHSSACGFVLAPDRLVTLRFAPSMVFDSFAEQNHETGENGSRSASVFAGLLETIVDRQADVLEKLRMELDELSHQVFHHRFGNPKDPGSLTRRNAERDLQAILVTLGRDYDIISFLRDGQLGVARIAAYVEGTAEWLPKPVVARLGSVQKDMTSLNEFSTHLTDKVQFLLDATLGLINIAQNGLIKVLTIVSIVGIPPTLIAGIYGMNFVNIPELHWRFGYAYAWVVMILSAIMPLAFFRAKRWL